jgi:F0F1-type ATP synthase delta subunit
MVYEKFSKDTEKYILDCVLDTSIVSGLKITIDGSLIDLTLENLNRGKF